MLSARHRSATSAAVCKKEAFVQGGGIPFLWPWEDPHHDPIPPQLPDGRHEGLTWLTVLFSSKFSWGFLTMKVEKLCYLCVCFEHSELLYKYCSVYGKTDLILDVDIVIITIFLTVFFALSGMGNLRPRG